MLCCVEGTTNWHISMQLRKLTVRNFRGIEKLDWQPCSPLICIVGMGDVGKSTILDAIEAVLSPRRSQFFDTDFPDCDTTKAIEITATVGELPEEAFREDRMGLHLRGWSRNQELHDEPKDGDESVVSVRLSVDETLEPVWELITDRQAPKILRQRDRGLFGLVRLDGETDVHLAWGQYSMLTRLSADKEEAANLLTEAYRKTRDLIKRNPLTQLNAAAEKVRTAAAELGAYSPDDFFAGLDTQRSSTSLAALTLHSRDVPLRMAGLGTRRLIALAVQRLAIPEGAIVLIDELEHGLESHRIRHALKVLCEQVGAEDAKHAGQVILTTHSAITVVELNASQLAVACRSGNELKLCTPEQSLQNIVRGNAEALLGRKIIVSEGRTEIGMLRGLRDYLASRHDNEPIEFYGVVLADGNGSKGQQIALSLASLGYGVALFRDSDVALSQVDKTKLEQAEVAIHEWPGSVSTEERIFSDISDDGVQKLLNIAYDAWGIETVKHAICKSLGVSPGLDNDYLRWSIPGKSKDDIRHAIGITAKKSGWYKRIDLGDQVGLVLAEELRSNQGITIATTLNTLEAWAYGD